MTTLLPDVRPSALAGLWYPADPRDLRQMINRFLRAAAPEPPAGRLIGLLAPHAGLRYSGPVAAYAFKLLEGKCPDVVAILCPYHRPPHQLYHTAIAATSHLAYSTPLGEVPVSQPLLSALEEHIPLDRIRHDQEHALEIELPFLQIVLAKPFTLLPLMVVDQSPAHIRKLGQALATVLRDRNAILIASSDLSHFYPQETALALDAATLDAVRSFDPDRVLAAGAAPGEGACGRGPIAAVMWAARALGADSAAILYHATSGDTSGDYSQVVGYAAGAFYAAETAGAVHS